MKITRATIEQIEKEAKKYFINSSACHDWTHVERVKKIALKIGKKEKANLNILEIAVFLHDIAKVDELKKKGAFCHAEKGAEIAEKILEKYNFDKKTLDNILHCIKAHRYRNSHIPTTIEAKCLYDADKLDSIGAIGIGRDFLVAGMITKRLYTGMEKELASKGKDYAYTKHDTAILEYEFKLKFIKDKMLTKEGKRIAKERSRYMDEYFKRFWEEVEGKK